MIGADPFLRMEEAWRELSVAKATSRFNVWTGRGRHGRCVHQGDSMEAAAAAAWKHRPARVFEGFIELKKYRTRTPAKLERLLMLARQLAKVKGPTKLSDVLDRAGVQVGPKAVRELLDAMRVGELLWQELYPVLLLKADLHLTKVEGAWVVFP